MFATAESCTGGLIAKMITDVPGSSEAFTGGVVAYANSVKVNTLSVPTNIIEAHGAVSEQTALAMAVGAAKILGADVAVGVSGIAGPEGGTADKPVGTVCFGFVFPNGTETLTKHFVGNREQVRAAAADFALDFCAKRLA